MCSIVCTEYEICETEVSQHVEENRVKNSNEDPWWYLGPQFQSVLRICFISPLIRVLDG
jgi:hypothetical protein